MSSPAPPRVHNSLLSLRNLDWRCFFPPSFASSCFALCCVVLVQHGFAFLCFASLRFASGRFASLCPALLLRGSLGSSLIKSVVPDQSTCPGAILAFNPSKIRGSWEGTTSGTALPFASFYRMWVPSFQAKNNFFMGGGWAKRVRGCHHIWYHHNCTP